MPLPGIECGDMGPKLGYNSKNNGWCTFNNVKIPRD
jgi:acyl-CoA oxidase